MSDFLTESLETRMKGYEKSVAQQFAPRSTIIVRVDGVAFHTYTKGAYKPFDATISQAMVTATKAVQKAVQGCPVAYTQSDEATFLLTDLTGPNTEGWFGFKRSKLESVISSMFTYHFNQSVNSEIEYNAKPDGSANPAFFDARAFPVPSEDAPNVFVWRQRDCYRNYVQSVGRYAFGHSYMQGKSTKEVEQELFDKYFVLRPEMYQAQYAFGTTTTSEDYTNQLLDYSQFRNLIVGGSLDDLI